MRYAASSAPSTRCKRHDGLESKLAESFRNVIPFSNLHASLLKSFVNELITVERVPLWRLFLI